MGSCACRVRVAWLVIMVRGLRMGVLLPTRSRARARAWARARVRAYFVLCCCTHLKYFLP